MIDSYLIENRKTTPIIKLFLFNICLIIGFLIWGINTYPYKSFFHIHSKITNFNSYYVLEVLIPVKEVNQIINQNYLFIESKIYYYKLISKENNIIYKNNQNYQKIYLEIYNLDEKYLINNYQLEITIPKETKTIIKYLIE